MDDSANYVYIAIVITGVMIVMLSVFGIVNKTLSHNTSPAEARRLIVMLIVFIWAAFLFMFAALPAILGG